MKNIKNKKSEKLDKYLDFAWELKNICGMKVTAIEILVGARRTKN